MKRLNKGCLLLMWVMLFAVQARAVIETYDFASAAHEKRYAVMIDELRCPKCQNQNLAGSNSPIAKDLRRELHRMIEQGDSDDTIKAFMVKRYGNFVLYRPPVDKNTWILWSLPAVLGLLALLVVIMYRWRLAKTDTRQPLSEAEKKTLQEVLDQYSSTR